MPKAIAVFENDNSHIDGVLGVSMVGTFLAVRATTGRLTATAFSCFANSKRRMRELTLKPGCCAT